MALWLPASGSAATITVDSTGSTSAYTTVGAGLSAAAAGDTVSVLAGDYAEDLTISHDVILNGAGSATTSISGGTILTIDSGITA